MQDNVYWLGFSAFPGIGPKRFGVLLEKFGSARSAWVATESDLQYAVGDAVTANFLVFKQQFSLEKYAESLVRKNISYLLLKNDTYPKLLQKLSNAPFVLYVKGDVDLVAGFVGGEPHPSPLLRGEGKTTGERMTE